MIAYAIRHIPTGNFVRRDRAYSPGNVPHKRVKFVGGSGIKLYSRLGQARSAFHGMSHDSWGKRLLDLDVSDYEIVKFELVVTESLPAVRED